MKESGSKCSHGRKGEARPGEVARVPWSTETLAPCPEPCEPFPKRWQISPEVHAYFDLDRQQEALYRQRAVLEARFDNRKSDLRHHLLHRSSKGSGTDGGKSENLDIGG